MDAGDNIAQGSIVGDFSKEVGVVGGGLQGDDVLELDSALGSTVFVVSTLTNSNVGPFGESLCHLHVAHVLVDLGGLSVGELVDSTLEKGKSGGREFRHTSSRSSPGGGTPRRIRREGFRRRGRRSRGSS